MKGEMVKKKLEKGERVYGTFISSSYNPVATKMISEIDLDFVFLSVEHMPLDRKEISCMCQIYSSYGISPIVRIPYVSGSLARMYMDGGAQGIVAPYLETVEQAKELVGAIKYRPIKGKFLEEILAGKKQLNNKTREYLHEFNRESYLIIGIESLEAVSNLDKLISLEGVTGVFLGPHDLTCSMEIPEEYGNPEFQNLVVNIIQKCREQGVGVGIHGDLTAKDFKPFLEAGANLVLHAADIIKMKQKFEEEFSRMRSEYGDEYQRDPAKSNTSICFDD